MGDALSENSGHVEHAGTLTQRHTVASLETLFQNLNFSVHAEQRANERNLHETLSRAIRLHGIASAATDRKKTIVQLHSTLLTAFFSPDDGKLVTEYYHGFHGGGGGMRGRP